MDELATLVGIAPPPFIFIHDPTSFQTTANSIRNTLDSLKSDNNTSTAHIRTAIADGVSCFTSRILYDRILNSLADWTIKWEDGCANWSLPPDVASSTNRWNDSFDALLHGLRTLHHFIRTSNQQAGKNAEEKPRKGRGKGKEKQKAIGEDVLQNLDVRFAIVVEHAERLQQTMPDLLVPLTRLSELAQLDLTVIFLSQVCWEDMKPPFGASPDPYFIDIPPPKKEHIVAQLEEYFDSMARNTVSPSRSPRHEKFSPLKSRRRKDSLPNGSSQNPSQSSTPTPYHRSLRQFHSHFISVLCDVCYPFTHDPREIQYIAAARWPGFAQPVLDEHAQRVERIRRRREKRASSGLEYNATDMDIDEAKERGDDSEAEDGDEDEDEDLRPPTEDTRMRLSRLFKPTLTSALEELYPRLTNAAAWARLNSTPPDPDSISHSRPSSPVKMSGIASDVDAGTANMPVTPRATRVLRSSVPNTPHTPRTPYTPRTPRVMSYSRSYSGNKKDTPTTGLSTLPRLSKFILIAAFLASTNPAKSDMRMFGRDPDEKKRRRRRTISTTGTKAGGGPSKVPRRLLGPTPFPLDRLIAILGALLEDNDVDEEARTSTDELFNVPGEYTDMEISRVGVYTAIMELSSIWLLHRTSATDKLEGSPMFKCGISYDDTLRLSKELDVPLNDLLWDSM